MANIIIICIPVNEFSWRTRAETPDGAVLAVSSVEGSQEAALGKLARQNPQLFGIKDIRETPPDSVGFEYQRNQRITPPPRHLSPS